MTQQTTPQEERSGRLDRFSDETALTPYVVADLVRDEVARILGPKAPAGLMLYLYTEAFADQLVDRALGAYFADSVFAARMRESDPRDLFTAFMRHWAVAVADRQFPGVAREIPDRFKSGLAPQQSKFAELVDLTRSKPWLLAADPHGRPVLPELAEKLKALEAQLVDGRTAAVMIQQGLMPRLTFKETYPMHDALDKLGVFEVKSGEHGYRRCAWSKVSYMVFHEDGFGHQYRVQTDWGTGDHAGRSTELEGWGEMQATQEPQEPLPVSKRDVALVSPEAVLKFKETTGIDVREIADEVALELFQALQRREPASGATRSALALSTLMAPEHRPIFDYLGTDDYVETLQRKAAAAMGCEPFVKAIQSPDGRTCMKDIVRHWTVCEIGRSWPKALASIPLKVRMGPDPAFFGMGEDDPLRGVANCTYGKQMGRDWRDASGNQHLTLFVGNLEPGSFEVSYALDQLSQEGRTGTVTLRQGLPSRVEPAVAAQLSKALREHGFAPDLEAPLGMFSWPKGTRFREIYDWLDREAAGFGPKPTIAASPTDPAMGM